ncbi:hypothetical protein [Actinomyces procaprae]|uniref:hypothetical protein n=1 Tax=Actinomyces procaprae TaxID=2560010 RepID=UPI00109DCBDE|nr:hypothetical protein [Actinomyces procaprae]
MRRKPIFCCRCAYPLLAAALVTATLSGCADGHEEGDLSWQLGVLAQNWEVEIPSSVSLKGYQSSEVGPHGEVDAVYVVQARDVEGTWLDGDFDSPSKTRSEELAETVAAASAADIVGDVADLRCIDPLKKGTSDTLTVCRRSEADELILQEHVPIT